MGNSCWFSNIQHGRRHEPLPLMTMEDNLRYNKRIINEEHSYKPYDNYDGIEIPVTAGIPSDYKGVMGVPISFLDKYNPEQFEIIGNSGDLANPIYIDGKRKSGRFYVSGVRKYDRIAIRHKTQSEQEQ